ncbi:MAG: hypothetical protein AB8B50_11725 [Pirellulaceae bacterium]
MPRYFLLCLIFMSLIGFAGNCLQAQDPFGGDAGGSDPFGGGGSDPFGAGGDDAFDAGDLFGGAGDAADVGAMGGISADSTPGVSAGGSSDGFEKNPIVRMLRESPPTTPEKMSQALTWMSRIRRWEEVKWLLDLTASRNWNTNQKAALSRMAGPSLWFRIRSDEAELSENQRALVTEILRAPSVLAQDVKWIDQWIQRLGSDQPGERKLAQLKLQDANVNAVKRLVNRLMSPDTSVAPVELAKTLMLFEQDGTDALRSATVADDPEAAGRVLAVLPLLSTKEFSAEIAAGLQSNRLPNAARELIAENLLSRYSTLPDVASVQAYLKNEFENRLLEYFEARNENDEIATRIWGLTDAGDAVQAVDGSVALRSVERLKQIAVLRDQTGSLNENAAIANAVAYLQQAYQTKPGVESEAIVLQAVPGIESRSKSGAFWREVFNQASQWQMHGAALRSLQMLPLAEQPLETLAFLSEQLFDPRPVIRFTALETISKIDPQLAYRGSEQALKVAIEMSRLGGGPRCLVIGLRADLLQTARQQIEFVTNGQVELANSGRAALLSLDSNVPFELIFVVDRVADQRLFELLQRIRNTRRGRSVPMVVTVEELYSHESSWIQQSGGVLTGVLSRNAEQMQRMVREMLSELDTRPLTLEERSRFAGEATDFLAQISSNQEQYPFYVLADYRDQITSTSAAAADDQRIRLLSGIGNAESQFELVRNAASSALGEKTRIQSAAGFAVSVRRFGGLLNEKQVSECYDLYNQFGPSDSVAVRVLGHILDVLEAQSGKASWPEALQ